MKQISAILSTVLLAAVTAQYGNAALIRNEQVVGYATGALGTDSTRGSLNGWDSGQATAFVGLTNGSGSLNGTNLGLVASSGDRVFLQYYTNVTLAGARNQLVGNGTFGPANETNLYFSFIYKVTDANTVSTNGQYVAQIFRANSGTGTPQHWAIQVKNSGGQLQLGVSKAGAPNNVTNYASSTFSAGDTVFVVLRQHMIPAAQNDIYDLWINPPPESFGTNELNIPQSVTNTGALTTDGAEDVSTTGPGRFVFFAGVQGQLDEFRFATTWAEATPYFGQCLPAGVSFVSPTSVTNVAGISSAFTVALTGTSPTVQWQRSTNGGTAWFDLIGSTANLLTTPNLQLSESPGRFRAIVNVSCNGSFATSSVALVTVTNPVVTASGVLVDDTFTDPELGFDSRNNQPFSVTNSLWYTDNDESDPNVPGLYAFLQGGNLKAVPKPGASSLWLGYFTASNQVVHLDINRALKVTYPFTANSYASFTNNSRLRIGLYDYFDAGTRVSVDGPNLTGSRGNGNGVRGYLLNLDFGPTFSQNSPLQLLARSFLADDNLMGSIGDFLSFGSGPAGGGYTNVTAFVAGTQYTLEFTVTRTAVNTCTVSANITGGGTNWSHSITDTNFAYHRFDSFALRPNSLETSADSITSPEFKVEVLTVTPPTPDSISISSVSRTGNNVTLNWDPTPAGTYTFAVQRNTDLTTTNWVTLQGGITTTTYTDTTASGSQGFYRVVSP